MTEKISVNSQAKLSEAITMLTRLFRDKKFVVVSMRPGKDRTLDQNALWFAMYERIAKSTEMGDIEDVRRYCKLHLGVPIMRAGCAESFIHLDYDVKLRLMGPCAMFGPDGFPVTRLFDRAQGCQYTDRIVAEFAPQEVFFSDLLSEEAA
ncbi:hypothetical protein [Pseudomonas protegens]|uniref:hypothetical protein n=1 Tax=Pseudomonas protegens TaxID=380021 RepID=UPI001B31DBC7|nr:hypothetical protein [Pseudomonas protegens]